jgi:5'-3' exonuclease
MEKRLHIVEIAPLVHAGFVNTRAEIEGDLVNTPMGYKQQSIPSGGVSFIFNKIYEYGFKDMMVFVADRYADKKKAINPDYKATREGNHEKNIQMKLAEIVLQDCGFQVLYEEGYEADDLVYSLAAKYKSQFDRVFVHTGDSDLYVCVDKNVEILPASSRNKHVTRDNYERTVEKNSVVPYNSLTFSKVLYGEKGDNIPPLPADLAHKLRHAFYAPFYYEKMGDKKFMRTIIEALFPAALSQFDLVYPLDVDVEIDIHSEPDLVKAQVWGRTVGNNRFTPVNIVPQSVKDIKAELFKEGSEFIND